MSTYVCVCVCIIMCQVQQRNMIFLFFLCLITIYHPKLLIGHLIAIATYMKIGTSIQAVTNHTITSQLTSGPMHCPLNKLTITFNTYLDAVPPPFPVGLWGIVLGGGLFSSSLRVGGVRPSGPPRGGARSQRSRVWARYGAHGSPVAGRRPSGGWSLLL